MADLKRTAERAPDGQPAAKRPAAAGNPAPAAAKKAAAPVKQDVNEENDVLQVCMPTVDCEILLDLVPFLCHRARC